MKGGDVEVRELFSARIIDSTFKNPNASAASEHHEWKEMYPEFARKAVEECFA